MTPPPTIDPTIEAIKLYMLLNAWYSSINQHLLDHIGRIQLHLDHTEQAALLDDLKAEYRQCLRQKVGKVFSMN
jgi:hypothetical protein